MASITSLMGGTSSTSSIYGTRNVISGLASGLDTETLIANSVSGLKLKITSLQQDRQKVEWEQEALRSIISKLSNFSSKYTSYTSATNLLSPSFFNSAVTTTTNGANASKVSATGKTSSDVQINSVSQLATAARYSVGAFNLAPSNEASGDGFKVGESIDVGTLSGTLSLGYGGKTLNLSFSESDVFEDAKAMADAINKQLEEETITFSGGTQAKASDRIRAVASEDGKSISFETVKENDGNSVWIKSASGTVKTALGIGDIDSDDKSVKSFSFDASKVSEKKDIVEHMSEKGFSIVLDGVVKTVKGPTQEEITAAGNDYAGALQKKIDEAFGEGKLTVSNVGSDGNVKLRFEADPNSKFQVTANASAKDLGMEGGLTSYVNTKRTLGDLLEVEDLNSAWRAEAVGTVTKNSAGYDVDEDGNRVVQDGDKWYQVNSAGENLYAFKVNGETVATVTKDTTMQELMTKINGNEDSDVSVAYSEFTGKFTFTARDTGAAGKINFGDGLAAELFGSADIKNEVAGTEYAKDLLGEDYEALQGQTYSFTIDGKDYSFKFTGNNGTLNDVLGRVNGALSGTGMRATGFNGDGSLIVEDDNGVKDVTYNDGVAKDLGEAIGLENGVTYTAGQDAKFSVTVNGETRELTRSTNNIDIDGMNVTLKGTFTEGEAVTFTTSADADKIVDAVKAMIDDYNAMATEIKNAYSTMPEQNSSGKYYEPLTEEDKEGMSESSIKSYEEKAKAGLLFADRDLSNLYNDMLQAIQNSGLEGIGINLSYADGLTTLTLDESKLRSTLAENPEKVTDVFTRSQENGASTDSFLNSLKDTLEYYGKTTGTKGLLVEKAGSTLAPTSLYTNELYNEMVDIDEEIEKWQDKISDQIDYYTNKFTYLEQLIAQMNNQSSMLMGLSGG